MSEIRYEEESTILSACYADVRDNMVLNERSTFQNSHHLKLEHEHSLDHDWLDNIKLQVITQWNVQQKALTCVAVIDEGEECVPSSHLREHDQIWLLAVAQMQFRLRIPCQHRKVVFTSLIFLSITVKQNILHQID